MRAQTKRGRYILLSIFITLLLISLASAGVGDWWKKITGQPISPQPQNVSVTVVGINPVSISVVVANQAPLENNKRIVAFLVNVTDPDGVNDIVDASVSPEFTFGPTTRTGTCTWQNDFNSTSANYSCSVDMWYWDAFNTWNVRVEATDIGNGTLMNGTTTFDYFELKAMVLSPSTLNWDPLSPLATNQNSSNDPTIINNTGNYNGLVSISARDLQGVTTTTEFILASNFTIGATPNECTGTSLQDSVPVSSGINSNPGNLSSGGGIGQANVYYCIPLVPQVISQSYSTEGTSTGSWTVVY